MKTNLKQIFVTLFLFLISLASFGMIQEIPEVDLANPNVLIAIATPIVAFLVVKGFKKWMPKLEGIYTIALTLVVAGAYTAISRALVNVDLSWGIQLLLGLLAVAADQIFYQLSSQSKVDRKILKRHKQ